MPPKVVHIERIYRGSSLLERTNLPIKKNIAWGDVFLETFCGSRYSVVVAFLEVSRIDFRIDERSG